MSAKKLWRERRELCRPAKYVAFTCLGSARCGRTGERLAKAGSTARLIPSLRSGSRGVRLGCSAGGRFATGAANVLNRSQDPRNLVALG